MSRPLTVTISLLLNVVLATLLVAVITKHRPVPGPRPRPVRITTRPAPAPATTTAEVRPSDPAVSPPPLSFDWSQLAADDFKVYRDRLRAVGCPEQTVRDILLAEINRHFRQRRHDYLASVRSRFWDVLAQGGWNQAQETWNEPLDEITQECTSTITNVLGVSALDTDPEITLSQRTRQWEQEYYWLPEEKRNQLVALEEKFWRKLMDENAPANPTKEEAETNRRRWEAHQKELDAARQQILSASEFAEYQLRTSSGANWAAKLSGFEATEQEWRAVTPLMNQYNDARTILMDAAGSAAIRSEDGVDPKMAEEKQVLDAAVKQALGPDRYAQYERSANAELRMTMQVTRRYGLSDDVAVQVFNIQQAAQEHVQQVYANPDLTPEARSAAAAAMQRQTEQTLTATLGDRVMTTYRHYAGDWLKKMNQWQVTADVRSQLTW